MQSFFQRQKSSTKMFCKQLAGNHVPHQDHIRGVFPAISLKLLNHPPQPFFASAPIADHDDGGDGDDDGGDDGDGDDDDDDDDQYHYHNHHHHFQYQYQYQYQDQDQYQFKFQ